MNLPYSSLYLLPLLLILGTTEKSILALSLQVFIYVNIISPKLPLLQAELSYFSLSFLVEEMLQFLDHPGAHLLAFPRMVPSVHHDD